MTPKPCLPHSGLHRRPGLRYARRAARQTGSDLPGHPGGPALRPRTERLSQLRHLHRHVPCGALLRFLAARDRAAAVDGKSRRHLRCHAGEDLVLRTMLHVRRALPVRQFTGWPCHADARSRHQASDAKRQGCAAPVQPRDVEADLDRQPARARHDQSQPFRRLGAEHHQSRGAAEAATSGHSDGDAQHHADGLGSQSQNLGRTLYDLGNDRRARSTRGHRRRICSTSSPTSWRKSARTGRSSWTSRRTKRLARSTER